MGTDFRLFSRLTAGRRNLCSGHRFSGTVASEYRLRKHDLVIRQQSANCYCSTIPESCRKGNSHCSALDSTKNPDSEAAFATTQIKQIAQIHQLPADCRGRLADTTMATCAPGSKSIGVAIALCQSLPLPQPAQSAYPLSPIIAALSRCARKPAT